MIHNFRKKLSKHTTLIKYIGLQGAVYAMDLLIYSVALLFLPPSLSQGVSKFLCGVLSFLGQKAYVFNTPKKSYKGQAFKYVLLWLINIPVTAWLVGVLYAVTNETYVSKIVVDIAAFIINYIITKKFIFKADE